MLSEWSRGVLGALFTNDKRASWADDNVLLILDGGVVSLPSVHESHANDYDGVSMFE